MWRDLGRRLEPVGYVAFYRDGGTLLAEDTPQPNRLRFLDSHSLGMEKDALQLPPGDRTRQVSNDGKTLMTFRSPDASLRIWDLPSKRERLAIRLDERDQINSVTLAPDGGRVLVTTRKKPRIDVWDAWTGKQLRPIADQEMTPGHALLFPDGRLLTTTLGMNLDVRDFPSGRVLRRLLLHPHGIHTAALSIQGNKVATGNADHSICLYDLESGQRSDLMHGHRERIESLAFSPDGKTLASGSWDGTVRLWHVTTGRELLTLDGHRGKVNSVAFSADGCMLLSRGEWPDSAGEALLWDAPKDGKGGRPEKGLKK